MILIDTNVISQLTRSLPDTSVFNWIEANENEILVSTVSLGEMAFGMHVCLTADAKMGCATCKARLQIGSPVKLCLTVFMKRKPTVT